MTDELCNHATDKGPCNMPKGHEAPFHRYRTYERVYWRIKVGTKVLSNGNARVPLNYAITDALTKHDKIVVELERG